MAIVPRLTEQSMCGGKNLCTHDVDGAPDRLQEQHRCGKKQLKSTEDHREGQKCTSVPRRIWSQQDVYTARVGLDLLDASGARDSCGGQNTQSPL